jgi:hypothetical protein
MTFQEYQDLFAKWGGILTKTPNGLYLLSLEGDMYMFSTLSEIESFKEGFECAMLVRI